MQLRSPFALSLFSCLSALAAADLLQHRATSTSSNELINGTGGDPGVYPGSTTGGTTGWRFMPDITSIAGATLDTTSMVVGTKGSTLTNYITSDYTASNIKRAVVIIHGEDRPSWNLQIYATLALQRAVLGGTVKEDEVVIMAPQFFIDIDYGAFPADSDNVSTSDQMVWNSKTNGWGQGDIATSPSSSAVGSFDALDTVLDFFHNKTTFPALTTVVVAGFSMGGQLVQRYSVFRPDTSEDSRTKFWVSSPASYVYFNDSRPASPAKCTGFNDYKYGLNDTLPLYLQKGAGKLNLSDDELQARYVSRSLNFLVGTEDYSSGDTRCGAKVQGVNHVARVYNWVRYVLPYLSGGSGTLPTNTTVDYVVKASHDPYAIINSDPGIQRLFLDDYNGAGQDAAAPPSNGYVSGQPTTSELSDTKSDGSGTLSPQQGLLLAISAAFFTAFLTF
ncbi:hypothetical protein CBS101457_005551 [Exobasidium rhododendri]|nr:hypothetical protein CBS101457_005551 [Exobasidium rhododendri]